MAMRKTHDLAASTGEYLDSHGEKKKRWQNCGAMFEDSENGRISIKVEAVPVGPEWSGWFSAFPVERNQAAPQQAPQRTNDDPY